MLGGRRTASRRLVRTSTSTSTSTTIDTTRGSSIYLHIPVLVLLLLSATAAATAATTTITTPLRRFSHHHRLLLPHGHAAAPALAASTAFLQPHRPTTRRSSTATMSAGTGGAGGASTTLLPHLAAIRDKATVILASKSPRRVEIMGLMGLAPPEAAEAVFRVVPSDFPEDLDKRSFPTPAEYAATNAECKAREVAARMFAEQAQQGGGRTLLVIGSDTIVDRDGAILEKPDDAPHAFAMLSSLQGRRHLVHSGVAVFSSKHPSAGKGEEGLVPVARFCETAQVTFCPLTEEEIWSYVRSGEPMDKAGSYGIQGLGGQMVQSIAGCYFTVMGLPMHRLSAALARLVHEGLV